MAQAQHHKYSKQWPLISATLQCVACYLVKCCIFCIRVEHELSVARTLSHSSGKQMRTLTRADCDPKHTRRSRFAFDVGTLHACGFTCTGSIHLHGVMKAKRFQSSDSVFAPSELEFLAEEELVTIISKVSTSEADSAGRTGYLSLLAGVPIHANGSRASCHSLC